VVIIISLLSLFLFITYGVIFRSVNEKYIRSVISENGNNIGYLLEGALFRGMLLNDRTRIQTALDRINHMSGIESVSMYDQDNNLAYTSLPDDSIVHKDPDCKGCHRDFSLLFSETEKSYRIIDKKATV
jgi:two-component system NtrC family sensor kinase